MPNFAVTHLGFLGSRHTAIVSADDRGLAFSHLASRGTGALGRTVTTTRILGRYPGAAPSARGKPPKPSTVLAFASLPLGNVERAIDTFGLTAMLTPYLLVIVSTTPIALTQHRCPRPKKEIPPHSAVTGSLAWFPAVKLKFPDTLTGSMTSNAKLVYCWSNILTILDVDEVPSEDPDKLPSLKFKARSRWKCDEAIVAVQWLSRSVITVLTITQRLIVIEDHNMRMTEAFDLIHRHIYHTDLFSKQLHALVEQLDEEDSCMHGVVADAFYMSFKTYKNRVFLFGFNDISIGALSNWADRLIALMEHGDYLAAIQLATSYYIGDANKLTVGLPENGQLRHSMVKDKVVQIMTASLKYAFSHRQKNRSTIENSHLKELAETCFSACKSIGMLEFVFDEMYEWYEEGEAEGLFLETMEPYILEREIQTVPPTIVKALVAYFVHKGWESRLEEMICRMETSTLDLDQLTTLCKKHGLYDALIYVWNQALGDYITPMVNLLSLLLPMLQNGGPVGGADDRIMGVNALKLFPYLSYILTGRVYPLGDSMDDEMATKAKAELYWFLFSGKSIAWPRGSSCRFLTRPEADEEPSFPYLRLILRFDAPSFLSALNEAFEDSFLNDSPEKKLNGDAKRNSMPEEHIFSLTIDRQYIVSILLEIMDPSDFAPEDTIYLDMFVARNLPKFPQYLLFPGSTLSKVLTRLCNYPGQDLAEDAQLSAEYLLSSWQPPDINEIIPIFKKARFYRILKRIYKAEGQYGKLVQAYFEDLENRKEVFGCITNCLRPKSGLTPRQTRDVHEVIHQYSQELVALSPGDTATILSKHAPELHSHVLTSLADDPHLQYLYLKTLLEPDDRAHDEQWPSDRDHIEMYLKLMCRFDTSHVSDYIGTIQCANLRLEALLPTMEETGVIDAAVVLLARDGQVQEAMARLTKHMLTLESGLHGILSAAINSEAGSLGLQGSAEELVESLRNFTHVGIWLCQGQMRKGKGKRKQSNAPSGDETVLSPEEILWLNLIESTVQVTQRVSAAVDTIASSDSKRTSKQSVSAIDCERLLHLVRSLVQHTFTALLTATTSANHTTPPSTTPSPSIPQSPFSFNGNSFFTQKRPDLKQRPSVMSLSSQYSHSSQRGDTHLFAPGSTPVSFLKILRAFLSRAAASSPSLADIRQVLSSIFSAYMYETRILALSNKLLDESLFTSVKKAATLRSRGWRPRSSTCDACKQRVWGPGVSPGRLIEAWEDREEAIKLIRGARRVDKLNQMAEEMGEAGYGVFDVGSSNLRGKGKKRADTSASEEAATMQAVKKGTPPPGSVFTEENAVGGGERGLAGDLTAVGNSPVAVLGPLVVLACRHVYHQSCLEQLQEQEEQRQREQHKKGAIGLTINLWKNEGEREFKCPIDG